MPGAEPADCSSDPPILTKEPVFYGQDANPYPHRYGRSDHCAVRLDQHSGRSAFYPADLRHLSGAGSAGGPSGQCGSHCLHPAGSCGPAGVCRIFRRAGALLGPTGGYIVGFALIGPVCLLADRLPLPELARCLAGIWPDLPSVMASAPSGSSGCRL